jgi:ferredoxin
MKNSDKIRKQIEEAELELTALKISLDESKADEYFKCGSCEKASKFKKLTLIKKHTYTKGYGYTDGEYNFRKYTVLCHKCSGGTDVWEYNNSDKVDIVKDHVNNFMECLDYMPEDSYSGAVTLDYLRKEQAKRNKTRWY